MKCPDEPEVEMERIANHWLCPSCGHIENIMDKKGE